MRNLILLSSVLLLSGCSIFMKPEIQYVEIPVPTDYALIPAVQPDPIQTKEVEFNVISKKEFMEALINKYNLSLDTSAEIATLVFEDDISLFTVNAKTYGNLGENMQEILRFIREQREVVQYYRDNVPEPKAPEPKKKDD